MAARALAVIALLAGHQALVRRRLEDWLRNLDSLEARVSA
jgi:hypothetical protein